MKKIIKKISRNFGYDIIEYSPNKNFTLRILKYLKLNNIDTILDVGANEGFYAKELFEVGYKGKVICFEPLLTAYKKLLNNSRSNSNWQIAERCAIGNYDGKIKLNISNNSVSSSVLQMMGTHINADPNSVYVGNEEVNIYRLDTIAPSYISNSKNIFLKIDVQGFENSVIDGATDILHRIKGIQLEMSLIQLYEGQLLFEDMLKKLKIIGFDLYSLNHVFSDEKTLRMLQLDGIFFNSKILDKH